MTDSNSIFFLFYFAIVFMAFYAETPTEPKIIILGCAVLGSLATYIQVDYVRFSFVLVCAATALGFFLYSVKVRKKSEQKEDRKTNGG